MTEQKPVVIVNSGALEHRRVQVWLVQHRDSMFLAWFEDQSTNMTDYELAPDIIITNKNKIPEVAFFTAACAAIKHLNPAIAVIESAAPENLNIFDEAGILITLDPEQI